MGFFVSEPDAGEAQDSELTEPDWYSLYCQAIAAGVDAREFGNYTYSQVMASIDAHKLRRFNDMYFNVSNIVSQMSDENVRDSLLNTGAGNPQRSKLVQKMLRPYTPSFMLPELSPIRQSAPIEGLKPKAAEGIIRAIENKLVPHMHWMAMKAIWPRILATARLYKGD